MVDKILSFLNSAKLQQYSAVKMNPRQVLEIICIFFIISAASGGNSVSGAVENGGGGSSSNNQAQPSENQKMEDKRFPKCRLCNYRYFTRLDLCRHFVDYHLRSRLEKCLDPASQRCPACALTYDKKQSRLRHFIWSHQDLEGLVVQDAQVRLSEFMPSLRYFKNSSYYRTIHNFVLCTLLDLVSNFEYRWRHFHDFTTELKHS